MTLCLLTHPLAHYLLKRPLHSYQDPYQHPHLYFPLCPSLHSSCLGSCHFCFNENPFNYCRGRQNLRSWVTYHSLTSLEEFLICELDTLQYYAITVFSPSRDTTKPNSFISLNPNSIRHLIMLRKYIHHLVQDSHLSVSSDVTDHYIEPDNFLHTTFHQFMSWQQNDITTSSPSQPPSVTASYPKLLPQPPHIPLNC